MQDSVKDKLEFGAGVGLGLWQAAFSQPLLFLLMVSAIVPKRVANALHLYIVVSTLDRIIAQNNASRSQVTSDLRG
jgi:hypothetical protein